MIENKCPQCGRELKLSLASKLSDKMPYVWNCACGLVATEKDFDFQLRTHNEMPKDTVEELAKELAILFQVEGTRQEKKIRNAIITAYNKGVEVGSKKLETKYKPFISEGRYVDLEAATHKNYPEVIIKCDTREEAKRILEALTPLPDDKI